MTLRVSGLTDQERARTLTNLGANQAAVEGLENHLEALRRTGHAPPVDSPSKAPS